MDAVVVFRLLQPIKQKRKSCQHQQTCLQEPTPSRTGCFATQTLETCPGHHRAYKAYHLLKYYLNFDLHTFSQKSSVYFVGQAIDLIGQALLDAQLAHLFHLAQALDAFFHLHLDSGQEQV
jgi:hypothetical protein